VAEARTTAAIIQDIECGIQNKVVLEYCGCNNRAKPVEK
jgi:hypothetical protein